MKQTVEEAAIAFANKCHAANIKGGLDYPYDELDMRNAFEEGVKWQSKQSPWISVKERLPEYNKKVIVLRGDECFISLMYNFCWAIGDDQSNDLLVSEKDFWLPIPSFDEIIEANKDVLQRIKEKGDW